MRVIGVAALRPRVQLLAVAVLAVAASDVARTEDWSARDDWQRPAEVMDMLGLGPGAVVADIGCGDGYFSFRLAERVGSEGRVLAVDVDAQALHGVQRKAEDQALGQIEAIQGSADDPRLPEASLDAILVVNAYHEMTAHDAMLLAFRRALKPGGRLAIIDRADEPGEGRQTYQGRHSLPKDLVVQDATRHGFVLRLEAPGFVRPRRGGEPWYFLVFERRGA